MFSYLSREARTCVDHPLRAIRAMADLALASLSNQLDAMYAKTGRQSIPSEKLLSRHDKLHPRSGPPTPVNVSAGEDLAVDSLQRSRGSGETGIANHYGRGRPCRYPQTIPGYCLTSGSLIPGELSVVPKRNERVGPRSA